jgi:hypothetical protein
LVSSIALNTAVDQLGDTKRGKGNRLQYVAGGAGHAVDRGAENASPALIDSAVGAAICCGASASRSSSLAASRSERANGRFPAASADRSAKNDCGAAVSALRTS